MHYQSFVFTSFSAVRSSSCGTRLSSDVLSSADAIERKQQHTPQQSVLKFERCPWTTRHTQNHFICLGFKGGADGGNQLCCSFPINSTQLLIFKFESTFIFSNTGGTFWAVTQKMNIFLKRRLCDQQVKRAEILDNCSMFGQRIKTLITTSSGMKHAMKIAAYRFGRKAAHVWHTCNHERWSRTPEAQWKGKKRTSREGPTCEHRTQEAPGGIPEAPDWTEQMEI